MADASIWKPGSTSALVNAESSQLAQAFVATAAVRLFTLTAFSYVLGTGSLQVFVNGVLQQIPRDVVETSTSSFTLQFDPDADDDVYAVGFVGSTNTAAAAVSAAAALASQTAAAASVVSAAASASTATTKAAEAVTSASAAAVSASAAAVSASASSASASAAAVSEANASAFASVGFNVASAIYDFGSITDASLTFTTDYGTVI